MVCESGTTFGGVGDHYSTMTVEDLYSLPVRSIAAKNCLLYLWATGPKLVEAMECLRRWGFKFSTVAYVWDKQHSLPGYYSCSQAEFVLVAKRGRCPRRTSTVEKQLVSSRRRAHSQKPEAVQDSIDRQWDSASQKIELFARREREGWTTVGNECPSTLGVDIRCWLSANGTK
jgi:N6-adenosine-specific RNA methylase IME4